MIVVTLLLVAFLVVLATANIVFTMCAVSTSLNGVAKGDRFLFWLGIVEVILACVLMWMTTPAMMGLSQMIWALL